MLKNFGDRAAALAWRRRPILLAKIMKVSEKRMRRVAVEGFFDQPRESINGGSGE
jgi:hypothetical protein